MKRDPLEAKSRLEAGMEKLGPSDRSSVRRAVSSMGRLQIAAELASVVATLIAVLTLAIEILRWR